MSEPSGYLLHGTAFSSKEAAFEILVHNHEQELRFHKLWDEDAQPYYFESQPQLTIPKSIAEQADKTDLDTLFKWGQQEFYQWFNHEQDEFMPVIYAYLVGKALGVDLVKVVEGIDDNY
ncbi:MAG: hypothetical protein L0J96_10595 [Lactococcus lactis]|nr:hypothetical protein [Lactococcus lactis]MDN5439252.1 hypothetical protein [Lactococcus lactis]MDN5471179.1 hypothetical protein [Lactococcus lactis]MDN5948043.1 hypothetical protein [Lactococcus lactis]MDN5961064.1 hypothetical protein [Lactococcus lactis]